MDFGGVEQVMANSIPGLVSDGDIEVSIIVLGKGGQIAQELLQKGIQVNVLNQNPRIPNFGLVFRLRKMLVDIKADVLHCQGGEANFHGILAGHWAGVNRIIGEEIGIPNHHSYWKYIFRWVYSKANLVIAISEAVKNAIVELGEVEEEKVRVVYNPVTMGKRSVDFSFLTSVLHGEPENDKGDVIGNGAVEMLGKLKNEKSFVFVTTCRMVQIKNLDRLILAFYEVLKEEGEKRMELWIVGDGPLKEKLIHQVKSLGIGSKVKFWGFQKNVFQFLEMADAFVLPSLREGSSVSLAEAMTCGLPSVVTQVGGACEILGSSKSGVMVDPLDVSSIKSGMASLATLTDLERKLMGERAMLEAERFSTETYLKSLEVIYKG